MPRAYCRKKERRQHSVRPAKILLGLVVIVPLLTYALAYGETPRWKVFSNRAGWSIKYPGDWRIASCRFCEDPTAPHVFVDFFPPVNTDSGWVMVEPLQDKPSGMALDGWFIEIKKTANLNPRLTEQRFILNDLPALKVRYRNLHEGGDEMEAVYVVSGSRTFAIKFAGDKPGLSLEKFGNYHTFLQMVGTFKVKR